MKNVWEYKATTLKNEHGQKIYKAFFLGEYDGLRTRKPVYQLVSKRTRDGLQRHEKRIYGEWQYDPCYRRRTDKEGNIYFLSWEELEAELKAESKANKIV